MPVSPSPTPPAPPPRGGLGDFVLAGLAVAFAVVTGSFAARNPDLWLHLAAGRFVAAGEYAFGADPFADTGRYWANHAWLFDLAAYLVFTKLGPAALVALKAAAAGGTAALMLAAARGRGLGWVAAGCVLLAVLALAPRLLLQPAVGSYLLLAACLFCLRTGGPALRAVPALVALWVNVDAWFILGPLLVGLFWLDRTREPWPRWLVPATLAACLLSPHHVRALTLPTELSPAVWASGFTADPRFAGVFASPWQLAPLTAAGGYNLAAGAFFALAALGAVSFLANRPAVRTWRGPVWLAFFALAAWQVRLVPFFAVVAGPILALNLGEVIPTRRAWLGRAAVGAAGVALVGLGWLGKATGFHARDRGFAWEVLPDPTLERTAAAVADWRRAHPDAPLFTAHPDVGHYLAWFAPGVRSSIDSRLALFVETADDYRKRSAMLGLIPGEGVSEPFAGAAVVYDPDPRRMTSAVQKLARWDIVCVPGAAVLAVPKGTAAAKFDPGRAAFDPPGASEITAADDGPAALGEVDPLPELTRAAARRGSWEADAAGVYLRLFEDVPDRSPALPLIALRAGRRGVERDPSDPVAWAAVGRAALLLDLRTWEADAGESLSPLAFVRHVQAVAALVQAVRLNPDSAADHTALAGVYARRGFNDLAFRHAAAARRLAGADRRAADLAAEAERVVQDAENRYLIRTTGQAGDPLARAQAAAELGLTQKAIDVLATSHPDLYGAPGLALLTDLLLQTGQAGEARALLDRDELRRAPGVLGLFTLPGRSAQGRPAWAYRFPAYDWYDFCQHAAAGRYPAARAAADRMTKHLEAEEKALVPAVSAALAAQVGRATAAAAAFAGPPAAPGRFTLLADRETARVSAFLAQVRFLSIARADLSVLAGVLELERGAPAAAAERFRAARALYAPARAFAPSLPGEPLAQRYLEAIDRTRPGGAP